MILAGALCALAVSVQAQVVELRATLSAQQEVPATSSAATGSAIMLYDVGTNTFDLVVSNPPFYTRGWGRESADARVHASTHAVNGGIEDFTRAAAHALSPHGRVVFVFDAGQMPALLLAFHAAGLTLRAAQFLFDDRGLPARVLVLAGRDGGGLAVSRA